MVVYLDCPFTNQITTKMATKNKIEKEQWVEFLSNERVELGKILSPYAELILKAEGWEKRETMTVNPRYSKAGVIVDLEKSRTGHTIAIDGATTIGRQERELTIMDVLAHLKDKDKDPFEHLNRARKYADKYDRANYMKFMVRYPEISSSIEHFTGLDLTMRGTTKTNHNYQAIEETFLLKSASIFRVAAELGYEPREQKIGETFIPKEITKKVLAHIHLRDVVEKEHSKMRYLDGSSGNKVYVTHSPFAKDGDLEVNPAGNYFICTGSGKKGDAVTFMMEHQQVGYVEAVKMLAAQAHVDLEKEFSQVKKEDRVLYVKDDQKVSLKVMESGIHTYFNVTEGQGGNIIKFIEKDAGVDQAGAFNLLRKQFLSELQKGNVSEAALKAFVVKALYAEGGRNSLDNPKTLLAQIKDHELVRDMDVFRSMSAPAQQLEKSKEAALTR